MSESLLRRWFRRKDDNEAQARALRHKNDGDTLLAQGDAAGAEASYRAAISAAPRYASAHTNLAYALHARLLGADAMRCLRHALTLDAAQADAHYLAAVLERDAGRIAEAERHYGSALELAPDMDVARFELCMLLAQQKRVAEAAAVINAGLARHPEHAELHFYLGNLRHNLGQFEEAVKSYRAAMAHGQGSPGLLNNFGLALLELHGDAGLEEAVKVFGQLVALVPESAEAHNHLGHALARAGDFERAIPSFERALALVPHLVPARFNLANTLLTMGKFEAAAAQYQTVLSADPSSSDAHFHLGAALQELSRVAEAEQHFRAALDLNPDHAEALHRYGCLLQAAQRFEEALDCHRRVLALQPANVDAHYNSGLALRCLADAYESPYREKKIDEAEAAYRAALAIDPDHLRTLNNLAVIMKERGEFEQSIACFRTILELAPQTRSAHFNLAVSLESWARHGPIEERLPRMKQALPQYESALAIEPEDVDSLLGIASVKGELGQTDEVLAIFERIFTIDPDLPRARLNHSLLLLSLGRYVEGWRDYEYRWRHDPLITRLDSRQPHWEKGIGLNGKTLLLYSEQGLGDSLQFVRYATVAARLGATVWVSVPAPLKLLFASCPGVARVFSSDEAIPQYDYLCPMLSMPANVGTNIDSIPAEVPYLRAAPDRIAHWRDKLGGRHGMRVGLVWAGQARKDLPDAALVDRLRSMHFDQIRPLLEVPGVEFHSLQVGRDTAAQLNGEPRVEDHADSLFDFQETAALAENLDLVICVDTSTAHLVGAIGKPVWLLNRFHTCWRWFTKGCDSPWYPTMRIFRQPSLGDWDSVIAEVKAALAQAALEAAVRR